MDKVISLHNSTHLTIVGTEKAVTIDGIIDLFEVPDIMQTFIVACESVLDRTQDMTVRAILRERLEIALREGLHAVEQNKTRWVE